MVFQCCVRERKRTLPLPNDHRLGLSRKESRMRPALGRIVLMLLALSILSSVALADVVPIGLISWDVTAPGLVGAFDIANETGANASIFPDMTFPVTTPVTITPTTLTVDFSDGSTHVFGPSYFTLAGGGGYNGATIPIGGANPKPVDATLTGTFSPLSITLNDGSTDTILSTFTATFSDSPTLVDGDFGVISATTGGGGGGTAVPEPASVSWVLVGIFVLGMFIFRGLPGKFTAMSVLKRKSVLPIALFALALMALPSASWAQIHENTWTTPDNGVAGVDTVNLIGSGFPTGHGAIAPADVTITFSLTCGGAVVASTNASSVKALIGTSERIGVALPGTLATATYNVAASGKTGDGTLFSTTNCSMVKVTHTSAAFSGCAPASSLGIFSPPTGPAAVFALSPNGCWGCGATGFKDVQLETGGGPVVAPKSIATGSVVNSCAANPATGKGVCVANDANVYTVDSVAGTLLGTFASGANASTGFSGGSCRNCGVAIDGVGNRAVIAMGHAGSPSGTAIQVMDLATDTFSAPVDLFHHVTEDIVIDPLTGQIYSANESNIMDLIPFASGTGAPTGQFGLSITGVGGEADSTAVDCSTSIVGAPFEFTSSIVLADASQATLVPGAPGTWSAPHTFFTFAGASLSAGASGMVIAPGSSHLGVVTGEFGGSAFVVIQLPATSGPGTPPPTVLDYAVVDCLVGVSAGFDPHTVSAYTSPNDGKAKAVFASGGPPPTSLAVVDLAGVLARPRTAGTHTVIGDAGACLTSGDGVFTSVPTI